MTQSTSLLNVSQHIDNSSDLLPDSTGHVPIEALSADISHMMALSRLDMRLQLDEGGLDSFRDAIRESLPFSPTFSHLNEVTIPEFAFEVQKEQGHRMKDALATAGDVHHPAEQTSLSTTGLPFILQKTGDISTLTTSRNDSREPSNNVLPKKPRE